MWVLTASFGGIEADGAALQKSKLLKTGKTYDLGRKDKPLIIKHVRISKDHAGFQVAGCTEDNISDPSFKPELRYINKRDKVPIRVKRGKEELIIEPLDEAELLDGDVVWPISSESISVKWEPLCCYYQPDKGMVAPFVQGCISLGINLVHTPDAQVTHHLVSKYTATASIATSLLSASQFVKTDWLGEIIRLSSAEEDKPGASQLEKAFALPPLSKYRPSFSSSLQDSQKIFRVWEPNEERLNMLSPYRFFLVNENVKVPGSDMTDLIQRGGGAYESLDVCAGKLKWHKALVRGNAKEGQKLVLVGEQESLKAAVGEREWQDLMHEVEIFNLPFISPGALVEAVINIDPSALNKKAVSGKELEASRELPSTNQDPSSLVQPGSPPARRRRLARGAVSRQASAEPMEGLQTQKPPSEDTTRRPRRALTRRTTALEDVSDATSAGPAASEVAPIDFSLPLPVRTTRLKRKRETSSEPVESLGTGTLRTSPDIQSVKRHKAVFDEESKRQEQQDMNVDEIYSPFNLGTLSGGSSQTRSESIASGPAQAPMFAILPVVHEEETQVPDGNHKGLKRKAATSSDVEMKENAVTKRMRRAQPVDAVAPDTANKPPSTVETRVNKLDVDTAFLKAVASTKKGKKKEDDFDRDFNNLRISRPELDRQDEEWDVVDDFGKDTGIRGNFMVILEMDVPDNRNCLRRRPAQSDWRGLPNFKKFKKKGASSSRAKVELVVSEENDYGLGPAYWKGGHSQLHGSQAAATQVKTEIQPQINAKGRSQALIINDSDEESDGIAARESQRARGRTRTKAKNAAKPLFLNSDNEEAADPDDSDGYASTLKSTARSQRRGAPKSPGPKTRSKKAPAVVVDDDDSDDVAVFKGFKGKGKGR